LPFAQTAYHQRVCSRGECQRVRRRLTQAKWRRRNRDYFRGADNVDRVREWRLSHPVYERLPQLRMIGIRFHIPKAVLLPRPLLLAPLQQDLILSKSAVGQRVGRFLSSLLQDLCVFLGVFVFC
jgi:hypothetical protein